MGKIMCKFLGWKVKATCQGGRAIAVPLNVAIRFSSVLSPPPHLPPPPQLQVVITEKCLASTFFVGFGNKNMRILFFCHGRAFRFSYAAAAICIACSSMAGILGRVSLGW